MIKFPLITALVLILCAIGVYANVKIIEDSVYIEGKTTDSPLSGSFQINNTGTDYLSISFSDYALFNGTEQLSISPLSSIEIGSGSNPKQVIFSVVIPNQKKLPGLYTGTLTATSNDSNVDTVTINVNVTPTHIVSTNPSSKMDLGVASLESTHIKTFNITNEGNADITNISFEFIGDGNFNLRVNKTNFVLPFNGMETIQFNITIPAVHSTGNLTLGFLRLVSEDLGLSIPLFDVKAEVGGGLIIEDLDVFLSTRIKRGSDGLLKSDSGNDLDVLDGRKLNFDPENAGPESEIRFNFNIENTFTDREDIDIDDISVKVTIEEIDDGDDMDEESKEFDLDSDSNEDVDVIFNIPLSVEQGVYNVIIEVQGEDDNGNEHTAEMNLKIDIDKEPRNVVVSQASLFPKKIKCSGTSTLTATIKNIGKRIEEDAGMGITNSDLNIDFIRQNIELEDDPFDFDNEFTKKLTINIGRDTEPGTYPITVNSYIHENALWESKTAKLVVESCSQNEQEPEVIEESDETENLEAGTTGQETTTDETKIPVLQPETTTEVSLTKSPVFWVVIILLNVIVIGAAAFFVVKSIGKKQ